MRSMQSVQSPALGSEGILDVLMQSAELLLIIGVVGAQGSRLLASWQQHQQAQECTNAHRQKVQSSTPPPSLSTESEWPSWTVSRNSPACHTITCTLDCSDVGLI